MRSRSSMDLLKLLLVLLLGMHVTAMCPSMCSCSNRDRVIDCSRRGLRRLPTGLQHVVHSLNFSHNRLLNLDGQLTVYTHLRILDLSYNRLRNMPVNLPRSLWYLNVASNYLQLLDKNDTVYQWNMRTLDLSNNKLQRVILVNNTLTSLHMLNLSHNRLFTLPTNMPINLKVADVSHNFLLRVLEGSLDRLKGLTNFYLHNNRINSMPYGVLNKLTLLKVISFGSNPWSCHIYADISYLISWTQNTTSRVLGCPCSTEPVCGEGRTVRYYYTQLAGGTEDLSSTLPEDTSWWWWTSVPSLVSTPRSPKMISKPYHPFTVKAISISTLPTRIPKTLMSIIHLSESASPADAERKLHTDSHIISHTKEVQSTVYLDTTQPLISETSPITQTPIKADTTLTTDRFLATESPSSQTKKTTTLPTRSVHSSGSIISSSGISISSSSTLPPRGQNTHMSITHLSESASPATAEYMLQADSHLISYTKEVPSTVSFHTTQPPISDTSTIAQTPFRADTSLATDQFFTTESPSIQTKKTATLPTSGVHPSGSNSISSSGSSISRSSSRIIISSSTLPPRAPKTHISIIHLSESARPADAEHMLHTDSHLISYTKEVPSTVSLHTTQPLIPDTGSITQTPIRADTTLATDRFLKTESPSIQTKKTTTLPTRSVHFSGSSISSSGSSISSSSTLPPRGQNTHMSINRLTESASPAAAEHMLHTDSHLISYTEGVTSIVSFHTTQPPISDTNSFAQTPIKADTTLTTDRFLTTESPSSQTKNTTTLSTKSVYPSGSSVSSSGSSISSRSTLPPRGPNTNMSITRLTESASPATAENMLHTDSHLISYNKEITSTVSFHTTQPPISDTSSIAQTPIGADTTLATDRFLTTESPSSQAKKTTTLPTKSVYPSGSSGSSSGSSISSHSTLSPRDQNNHMSITHLSESATPTAAERMLHTDSHLNPYMTEEPSTVSLHTTQPPISDTSSIAQTPIKADTSLATDRFFTTESPSIQTKKTTTLPTRGVHSSGSSGSISSSGSSISSSNRISSSTLPPRAPKIHMSITHLSESASQDPADRTLHTDSHLISYTKGVTSIASFHTTQSPISDTRSFAQTPIEADTTLATDRFLTTESPSSQTKKTTTLPTKSVYPSGSSVSSSGSSISSRSTLPPRDQNTHMSITHLSESATPAAAERMLHTDSHLNFYTTEEPSTVSFHTTQPPISDTSSIAQTPIKADTSLATDRFFTTESPSIQTKKTTTLPTRGVHSSGSSTSSSSPLVIFSSLPLLLKMGLLSLLLQIFL